MSIDLITMGPNHQVNVVSNGETCVLKEYHSIRQFMENLCVQNGTTLEGCYKASGALLKNTYKRPIYIGGACNQIFVPTSSIKNINSTWISLDYLMNISHQQISSYEGLSVSKHSLRKHLMNGLLLRNVIFENDYKKRNF